MLTASSRVLDTTVTTVFQTAGCCVKRQERLDEERRTHRGDGRQW